MIITALQQAKKDSNRVNLFLDNEFWICVDKNEILKFDLYKGKELSKEDKSSLEKSSKSTRALNKAYSYILRRPRSKKEITDYLSRKEIPEVTIKEIITELKGFNGYWTA